MKNYFQKLFLFAALSIATLSCSDDETKKKNDLSVDGASVSLDKVYRSQSFGTADADSEGSRFYLFVMQDGVFVTNDGGFDQIDGDGLMLRIALASSLSEELLPGTYTYQTGELHFPFIYSGSLFMMDEGSQSELGEVTGGTVTVTKSGTTYTITADITLDGDVSVKAYFKGTLSGITLVA